MTRGLNPVNGLAGMLAVVVAVQTGCATAPPPAAPAISLEQRMAWILQLEDQRLLRLPPPPPAPEVQGQRRRRVAPAPPPASMPDLAVLARDPDPRVRRRAALAIGRVKLRDGVAPLVSMLADADADVRSMAAFALGLLGDVGAEAALVPFLADQDLLVRGRAAEALGSIGATGAAPAIGKMVADLVRSPTVSALDADDEAWPAAPEAEALKLGLFALVRLRAYEPLAAAVLDGTRPVSAWWPVAFALQRIGDKRAAPALRQLLEANGRYPRAFAARGLGAAQDTAAVPALLPLVEPSASGLEVTVQAIRALAQMNAVQAVEPLMRLAADPSAHPNLRLEAVNALGALRAPQALDVVLDLVSDEWGALRSAALEATAAVDQESFIFALASLEPDRDWRVRATLARLLAGLPPDIALERVRAMLKDEDRRVRPAVLGALAQLKAPDLPPILIEQLKEADYVIRATAAEHLGKLKPQGGAAALREAYRAGLGDSAYEARVAALEALGEYGADEAVETLEAALTDTDWAVRLKAAELLRTLTPSAQVEQAIRPVPGTPPAPYDDPQLIAPEYSPHVYVDTAHGTIEFELTVLDAPQTVRNFMTLVRKGFFNGLEVHRVVPGFVVQDGDPRGDGHGGPGYTIRDELNERPFLRGTVGMALAGPDTGGSQFFITHSPQPHLDGRYTVFGRVVHGMEVVDKIRAGDVIERVRVWDGKEW